ncbi:MAG: SDR family oxidoreductase [Actinomycetota bacterium]|nr:SDR family oxidoreductase [Actinomycetota bacterium]
MTGSRNSVLITGASTGIGRAAAEHLAGEGWLVFAGVRGGEEVSGCRMVDLDVTSEDSVTSAAEEIGRELGGRLDAVVNNAGIPVTGAIETIPTEDWRRIVDTNLTGPFLVTKAMLPLIRAARGRILFVTSLGGRVAFPYAGAYHATKFGLEGMAESLRAEVRSLGVDVAVVEPGTMATEIWGKGRESLAKTRARMTPAEREAYGAELDAFDERLESAEDSADPEEVAKAIAKALTASSPDERYLVGGGAGTAVFLQKVLPAAVFDRVKERLVTPGA